MTQETLGFVHLEWTCPKCQSRNPGIEKTCQSCGAPQPQDVQFEQVQGQAVVQDEALAKVAKAGPDIHCPYCGTRNTAVAQACVQCGGDLSSGERRVVGRVIGTLSGEKVKEIACPNCHSANPETALKCANCGAPLVKRPAAAAPVAATKAGAPAKFNPLWLLVGLPLLLCLCVGGFFFMRAALSSEDMQGRVQDVSWRTVVPIEALGPVERDDWRDEIPTDAEVGECQSRVRSVVDSEPSGEYNKVCGTPYTVDTGSGVGQVVQDCQFEVLEPYCSYSVLEWQVVNEAVLQGSNLAPNFAAPQVSQDQRLGQREAQFTVVFETADGVYEYSPDTQQEFSQFTPGSEWILSINGFNQIVAVAPAR